MPRSLKSDDAGRNNEDGNDRAEELTIATQTETITVCRLSELPEGQMRLVEADGRKIGVFHCTGGELYAIEDRCSHDDGTLADGELDQRACTVECPRHGSLFDLRTGKCLDDAHVSIPAYDVKVVEGMVLVGHRKQDHAA